MTKEQILADERYAAAWEELDEVSGCTTADEFLYAWRDLSDETRSVITDEPHHFLAGVEPWSSAILRLAILPAFIAALNAQVPAVEVSRLNGGNP